MFRPSHIAPVTHCPSHTDVTLAFTSKCPYRVYNQAGFSVLLQPAGPRSSVVLCWEGGAETAERGVLKQSGYSWCVEHMLFQEQGHINVVIQSKQCSYKPSLTTCHKLNIRLIIMSPTKKVCNRNFSFNMKQSCQLN